MNYKDLSLIGSIRVQYSLYKSTHPLFQRWMRQRHKTIQKDDIDDLVLEYTRDKKSLWIDSFGHCFSKYDPKIISIEPVFAQAMLKTIPNIFCRGDLQNPDTHQEIAKTFNPEIVVYFKSTIFKYITISKLTENVLALRNIYPALCIYIDLQFINYNKIKYPVNNVIQQIQENLPSATLKRLPLNGLLINI